MSVAVREEVIAKILSIVRSYPEGITVDRIVELYEFKSSNAVRAALHVLQERGQVQRQDLFVPSFSDKA